MNEEKNKKSLQLIQMLTKWMDSKFKIPGTEIRFGIDALVGLIPGIGDMASTGVSFAILGITLKKGVPFKTALKMMGNIIFDAIITLIPFAGFFMDIVFKSNTRNLQLLENHLKNNEEGKYEYGMWWLFALTFLVCITIIIGASILLIKLLNAMRTV